MRKIFIYTIFRIVPIGFPFCRTPDMGHSIFGSIDKVKFCSEQITTTVTGTTPTGSSTGTPTGTPTSPTGKY